MRRVMLVTIAVVPLVAAGWGSPLWPSERSELEQWRTVTALQPVTGHW